MSKQRHASKSRMAIGDWKMQLFSSEIEGNGTAAGAACETSQNAMSNYQILKLQLTIKSRAAAAAAAALEQSEFQGPYTVQLTEIQYIYTAIYISIK